ncbi:hypothetical protein FACS1894105_09380 [Clostridia bacterium]|nr:hypothetical protein FACS1894105_09380 [Clostridia bacterium]
MKYIKPGAIKAFCLALALTASLWTTSFAADTSAVTAPPEYYSSGQNIRVGLVYDSGITESFRTKSSTGFLIGKTEKNNGIALSALFSIPNKEIYVTRDVNLAKNAAGKYYNASGSIVIGKYNIEVGRVFANIDEAYGYINSYVDRSLYKNPFPAYTGGGAVVVRFGEYSSESDAQSRINSIQGSFTENLYVSAAKGTTAVIIDPITDAVLFEFESASSDLAVAALKSPESSLAYGTKMSELTNGTTGFTETSAGNIYAGAFVYLPQNAGVEVVNLLALEDYVKGIVTSEISPAWPIEAIKAFALASRSYTLAVGNRHAGSGFEICNDIHCQLYLGSKTATDNSNKAVDDTRGEIITYDGLPIQAVYHSSAGGISENHNDAWGGTLRYPYLVSVKLPFEKYTDPSRQNALWTRTATGAELYTYLTQVSSHASLFRGKLTSSVASITIDERSPGSNYIKKVTVTDTGGHSVTLDKSDSIRSAFARFASSANMDIFHSMIFRHFHFFNSSGKEGGSTAIESGATYIMSANGLTTATPPDGTISVISAYGTTTKTGEPNGSAFIFSGKGWGHGVGMSQYGTLDMANLGYKYDEIVKTFYTGVEITNIANVRKS